MKSLSNDTGIAPLLLPPLTLERLHRYAQASGDFNPIHLSRAAAGAAGLKAPVAHGMFIMGQLEKLIRFWRPACRVDRLSVHFLRPLFVGDSLTLGARVLHKSAADTFTLRLIAENSAGEIVAMGEATVVIPA
jgi:3-hydroxybutyryl-CoA dehydratase